MQNHSLPPSELVVDATGAIYHLGLHPHQIANKIIVVGDPGRVEQISKRFDAIEHKVAKREFVTHTGRVGDVRITALSTGIGVDNIDIVINELDALCNIDLQTRKIKDNLSSLQIIRLGTCGALNADIPVGDFISSRYAMGLDGVMHFYNTPFSDDEKQLAQAFQDHVKWSIKGIRPYAIRSSDTLANLFTDGFHQGITATACGFYGPQGRVLRLPVAMQNLNDAMATFAYNGLPMANYEMESSALFALGSALGHHTTTVCTVVANRLRNEFAKDYKPDVERLITRVLEAFATH